MTDTHPGTVPPTHRISTDEERTHQPNLHERGDEVARPEPLSRRPTVHIIDAPGAGLKALRPLRGRAPLEP